MAQKIKKGVFYVLFLLLISCKNTPDTPIVFEVISNTSELNVNIPDNLETFKWDNHWLILAHKTDSASLHSSLKKIYPNTNIHVYATPIYKFDIKDNCNKSYSKNYKRYIFSANLVSDSSMQKEYLTYHHNQSKDWPGVAEGFCNAEFQQLLVYKNERQLILFIDIPFDKTLEEINPKTEANNPQMIEWNKRMSQYQVGLIDAPKGQVWVEFKKIPK